MVEVSLTVGKLDASLALLLTKDHHLIEFPTILLPNGVKSGSIVKIRCDRDLDTEQEEEKEFQAIQDEILATFGKNLPQSPILKIKNVTQTSCVLEWDQLELGTASLKNLVLFKDGKKLGSIPQPLTNRTTKLSGLPIDKSFKFQLRLDTTAGAYSSDTIEVKTHKMTDLSGITVCLGDITPNEQFTVDDIQAALKNMGAHYPAQDKLKVDTTHFITTRENKQNPEYLKANEMNIPIIRPEWLKACERERRIVGVRDFYVKDCALPEIFAKNYWQKAPAPPAKNVSTDAAESKEGISENKEEPAESQEVELDEVTIEPAAAEPEKEEPVEEHGDDVQAEKAEELPKEAEPVAESIPSVEVTEGTPDKSEVVEEATNVAAGEGTLNSGEEEADIVDGAPEVAAEKDADAEAVEETKETKVAAVKEELAVAPSTAAAIEALEEVDISEPVAAEPGVSLTEQEAEDKIKSVADQVKEEAHVSVPGVPGEVEKEEAEDETEAAAEEDAEAAEEETEVVEEETEATGDSKPAGQKKKNKKKKKGKK